MLWTTWALRHWTEATTHPKSRLPRRKMMIRVVGMKQCQPQSPPKPPPRPIVESRDWNVALEDVADADVTKWIVEFPFGGFELSPVLST